MDTTWNKDLVWLQLVNAAHYEVSSHVHNENKILMINLINQKSTKKLTPFLQCIYEAALLIKE